MAKGLKFAALTADTAEALFAVIGKEQLQGLLTGVHNLRCVGVNFHTLVDRVNTCCYKRSCTFNFNNAHTTGTDLVDLL